MLEPFAKTFSLVVILSILAGACGWWLRGAIAGFRSKDRRARVKSPGKIARSKGESRAAGPMVEPARPPKPGTRVVLHIGMPKSGTTALQHTLRANRKLLQKLGVIYPAGGGLPVNHNILVAPFLSPAKLPRIFREIYKEKPEQRLEDVRLVIQARKKDAHTVILSGEMLFKTLTLEDADQLRAMLLPIGGRITVVAYVRHPAKFYLSMAQQAIKASHRLPEPKGRGFHGGDITRDFCKKVLGFEEEVLEKLDPVESNETITAEGMDILQRYRKHACKNQNGIFTGDSNLLGKVIREVDPGIPNFGRPELTPEIIERIVRSSVDLPWLRDAWNIEFPDVDYGKPFSEEAELMHPRKISDICRFSPKRSEQLLFRVLEQIAKNQGVGKIHFKTAMPGGKA